MIVDKHNETRQNFFLYDSVLVLIVLCVGVEFVLFAPYLLFSCIQLTLGN